MNRWHLSYQKLVFFIYPGSEWIAKFAFAYLAAKICVPYFLKLPTCCCWPYAVSATKLIFINKYFRNTKTKKQKFANILFAELFIRFTTIWVVSIQETSVHTYKHRIKLGQYAIVRVVYEFCRPYNDFMVIVVVDFFKWIWYWLFLLFFVFVV